MTIQGDTQSTYFTADATTDGQTSTAHRQRLLAVVLEAGASADATVDIYKIQNDDKESIIDDLNNINRVKKILGGINNKNEK